MKIIALWVAGAMGLLAACSSIRDERRQTAAANTNPIPHSTIVNCPVYDGMKKTSTKLSQTIAGN